MVLEDKATSEWLNDQKTTTRYTYNTIFKLFMKYVGMNGDQILASRKQDTSKEWEKKVEEFNIEMRKTKSSNYVRSMMGCIRSFFQFYEVNLVYKPRKSKQLTEASRTTKDYLFTKEELAKMSSMSDTIDSYIICVGKSFGLRSIDFIALTRGDLEPYIDREPPIGIGEINTVKENVKAYPFIDTDAQIAIKNMLAKMDNEGRTGPNEKMLTFSKAELSTHLKKKAAEMGINNNGKLIRFHTLRKFLIDRLSSVTSESKWKQIVGKAISEGAYVSSELLRQDYKRVMPMTCFSINGPTGKVTELETKITTLEQENKMYKGILKELIQDKIDEEDKAKIEHLDVAPRKGIKIPIMEKEKPVRKMKEPSYWRKALVELEKKEE